MKKKIDKIIEESLKNNVFSACSVGFLVQTKNGPLSDIYNYGLVGENEINLSTDNDTFFDLASLTKPLVTSLCFLALMEEGKINTEDKLHEFFELRVAGHQKIQLLHLLTHSSGFPAHRPYYQKLVDLPEEERDKWLINSILAENLIYEPGTEYLYSDLGFILLGKIIEIVSKQTLDKYWQQKIQLPLKLDNGLFFASKKNMTDKSCATTGTCGWTQKKLCGVVHDDNCRAMGGVAGHAGLFGTCRAVLSLCENILLQFQGDRQPPPYSSENLRKVLRDKHGPWVFGFDTPTSGLSSSGKYFSDNTIGHLGFTGTSFWLDLQRGIAVVFLTNRVVCGDNLTAIKRLRPLLHDVIMEDLMKKAE